MIQEASEHKEFHQAPYTTRELTYACLNFIEALAGYHLYNYQKVLAERIISSVLNHTSDTITALVSRQAGKTETIADTSIGLAILLPFLANQYPQDDRFSGFGRGFWVGVYAPKQEQADTCFLRMREKIERPEGLQVLTECKVWVTNNRGDLLAFTNGSRIKSKTASEASSVEGATHHLVLLEESQLISQAKVAKEIKPMLTATGGSLVKVGTAFTHRGGFHDSIQLNKLQEQATGIRNHFEFPYTQVIAEKKARYEKEQRETGKGNPFHLRYERFIASQIKELGGEDSPEFRMNFKLEWQETSIRAIRESVLTRCALDGRYGHDLWEIGNPNIPYNWPIIGGLDVGKTNDSTVLTLAVVDPTAIDIGKELRPEISDTDDEETKLFKKKEKEEPTNWVAHTKWIFHWLEMYGAFEGETGQYKELLNFLQPYLGRLKVLVVDANGMGSAFAERVGALLEDHEIHIEAFASNLPNKHRLFKHYLSELNNQRLFYPAGPNTVGKPEYLRFVKQHLELERYMQGNYIMVKNPDGHDDYPDSAAMMCWAEKFLEHGELSEFHDLEQGDFPNIYNTYGGSRSDRYRR